MIEGFRFHDLAQLQAPVPPQPPRAPLAATVTRRAADGPIFTQPRHGRWAKWWAVEVRFDRPLTRREADVFVRVFDPWRTGAFGVDGAVWDQWWNSYPGEHDGQMLLDAMRCVDVPGVLRAAPFGRDCPGGWSCYRADDDGHRCRLGDAISGDPIFTNDDWIGVDVRRVTR